MTASLEEIARRAEVGIGTLYRHFPRGREQLVAEALIEQVARYVAAAEEALRAPDPGEGFERLVGQICAMQADDRGLGDMLVMALPAGERVEELRARAYDLAVELIQRAKAAGRLRPDFVGGDLLLMMMANSTILEVTRDDAPAASRRLVGLFLEAARAGGPRSDLPPAPSSEELRRAMVHLAQSRGCAVPSLDEENA